MTKTQNPLKIATPPKNNLAKYKTKLDSVKNGQDRASTARRWVPPQASPSTKKFRCDSTAPTCTPPREKIAGNRAGRSPDQGGSPRTWQLRQSFVAVPCTARNSPPCRRPGGMIDPRTEARRAQVPQNPQPAHVTPPAPAGTATAKPTCLTSPPSNRTMARMATTRASRNV